MKNKIIDFKTASAEGVYKGYTLFFILDNPTITYNGEVYNAIKPGEVLRHEIIKNPQPWEFPRGLVDRTPRFHMAQNTIDCQCQA